MSKGLLYLKPVTTTGQKMANIIKISIAVLLLVVLAAWIISYTYAEDVNAGLSQNLVRLHVVANSDSAPDQALKLKVRDAIIEFMKDKLANSKDINETRAIINANLENIEQVSSKIIKENNSSYGVKASMGNYSFPTKTYGDIALPAGEYQALKVVIGDGAGANWWCVLFPPLCFIDATHGTIPDSVKQDLKTSLSAEEFKLITTSDSSEDIPVKIKFKVVELFEGSKVKVTGAVNKMFK
ncbi:stage II sporulation protein R [Ruminiclostridium cellobioparum subsp. termitidis CT1112]|jgi:stage II sporulation protein R|uniref:Stage II sporulation protein R n=3 Tax=Ruminiclostridium cellobioparum TaxID=29355 RepID=S0FS49_RUMCE|nr:stage II sporulation protein R [Ruminiclostridium cellobioparum]EMS72009.1 stage II sporulation protein R [Ruminiclostridium cellobioparum subsp. termitidis CT1112]